METFLYMLPLIIVFVGFYFLAIRPLQKKYGPGEWEPGKRIDDYWEKDRNNSYTDGTPRMGAGITNPHKKYLRGKL